MTQNNCVNSAGVSCPLRYVYYKRGIYVMGIYIFLCINDLYNLALAIQIVKDYKQKYFPSFAS